MGIDSENIEFNIEFDIGRVHFVNTEKYTVDMVGLDGNRYQNLPFLNLYCKPYDQGQGIYMMPERDSYGIILKLGHQMMKNTLGADRFVIGFYNPMNEDGNYSSDREEINPGDFCFKTVFGNKIIGRTDGSITIKASDQSQMTLFPASGNKEDSFGFDNLLRAIFENFEFNTDGGHVHHHVNKKEKTTNLEFELRDKPLYSENPDIIRGNIGSQGPMGDEEYFYTLNVYHSSASGEELTLRNSLEWKTTGWKRQRWYDEDEIKLAECIIDELLNREIKTYVNKDGESILQYFEIISPEGSISRTRYDTSEEEIVFEEKISSIGDISRVRYNPETQNEIFEDLSSPSGTRTMRTYTGDDSNEIKSEIIFNDDGSIEKKIFESGALIYSLELSNNGTVNETINDPNEKKIINISKDPSSGKITEEVLDAGKKKVEISKQNSGQMDIIINQGEVELSLTSDGKIDITASGDLTAEVDGNANIIASMVNLGGESGAKVLTENTLIEHICPIIGSKVPSTFFTTPASKVKAE
ncbi:MAG: hypothetical protein ACOCT9_00290 [archaeon]